MSEFLSRNRAAALYWVAFGLETFLENYKIVFAATVGVLAGRHWRDIEPGDHWMIVGSIIVACDDKVSPRLRALMLKLRQDRPLDGDTQILTKPPEPPAGAS